MERGIGPNDESFYFTNTRKLSAVAAAARFGYVALLKLLLDVGCSVSLQDPNVLIGAVCKSQHESMLLLCKERPEEICAQLQKESTASWPASGGTALDVAFFYKDVEAVRILREHGNAMLLRNVYEKNCERILREMYAGKNVLSWSKELHWSFPGPDRRILNWLWYALQRRRDDERDNGITINLPSEVWLRFFGFAGRGWWTFSTLGDQNGVYLARC